METFLNVDGCPTLLRIETTAEQKDLRIPEFLNVIKDVTDDENYSFFNMTNLNYKMPEADKKSIKDKINEVKEK